ncbi:hypothetical protein ScPMuIL_008368 [Solemya velum]
MTKRASFSISSAFDFLSDPLYTEDGDNIDNGDENICFVRKSISDTQLLKNNNKSPEISLVQIDEKTEPDIKSVHVDDYPNGIIAPFPELVEQCHASDRCDVEVPCGVDQIEMVTENGEVETTCVSEGDREVEIQIQDRELTANNGVSCDNPNKLEDIHNSNDNPSNTDTDNPVSTGSPCSSTCIADGETDKNANIKIPSVENEESLVECRVTMRNLPRDSQRCSRRTERIVSDAFQFLKLEDDNTCDIILDPESTIETCRSNSAAEIPSQTSSKFHNMMHRNIACDKSELNGESDLLEQPLNSVDSPGTEVECIDNVEKNQNDSNPSGSNAYSSSEHTSDELETNEPAGKKRDVEKTDDNSDSSSDDDTHGIYNATTRNSRWLCVDENGSLSLPTEAPEAAPVSGQIETSQATSNIDIDTARKESTTDDVFGEGGPPSPFLLSHKRSNSTTTTVSEREFKQELNKYNSIRKCFVKRHDSQQEYQRFSARYYDLEKSVFIEKKSDDGDIGLHILDSHPAVITSVDPESPAEKAGIQVGQILISVNGVNVLELPHSEIIKLVQQYPRALRLEVGFSDISVVRDLQVPMLHGMMFKQSTSGLIKTWKKRYFVLRQDNCLYYYKNKTELDPLGAIPLTNYSVSRFIDTNKQYCFKAEKYGARTYYFMTESRGEMTKWVGALNAAADRTKNRTDSWMDVTSHNVGLPALEIRKPECTGYLSKLGRGTRSWRKRYCVLKDACIYYYKAMSSYSAQGVAHLHGYSVDSCGVQGKKLTFALHPPEKQMRTFYFCADNHTDRLRWMDAMTKSIQRWVCVNAENAESMVDTVKEN